MPGGRRGLVAPQNTFLENVIRRYSSQRKYFFSHFIVGNFEACHRHIIHHERKKTLGKRISFPDNTFVYVESASYLDHLLLLIQSTAVTPQTDSCSFACQVSRSCQA